MSRGYRIFETSFTQRFLISFGLILFFAAFACGQRLNAQNRENETSDFKRETFYAEQPEKSSYKLKRGAKEINLELGFSPFQPTFFAEKEYDTAGRKFMLATFRFGRVIGTAKGVTSEYLFEVTPLAISFKNEVKNKNYVSPQQTPNIAPTRRKTTFGFGFQPAVFRFIFMPEKRLKPFVQTGVGMMFTNNPLLVPDATSYNFTGDFGGGLQFYTEPKKAITFGYRYFHISNFNTTNFNPGYNANIFNIGFSYFR